MTRTFYEAHLTVMLLGSFLAATSQRSLAQGTFYTSRALFEQQLSSRTIITMESLPLATDTEFYIGQGNRNIAVAGASFMSSSGRLFVSNPGHLAYPIPGDGQYIFNFDSFSPVSILMPGGVTAFGADFSGGLWPNPTFNATLTVNLAGGGSYEYSFVGSRGAWTFVGVIFPEPTPA